MNFFKSLFKKKTKSIKTYNDFWDWFQENERAFYDVVKGHENIENGFFDHLAPRLEELKEDIFYVTGMFNNDTAELILTADSNVKNIAFVEELVSMAPQIKGWKFTALKPALKIEDVCIEMSGYKFDRETLSFYANKFEAYPDEIDITIVHNELNEENKEDLISGIYIFLDNYLGELDFANNIDNLEIKSLQEAKEQLIPISKLKDYLIWRQKEFVEKYEGVRYYVSNDNYALLERTNESGVKSFAVVNTELLNWDSKASHPWISVINFRYESCENGIPNSDDYKLLEKIEEELLQELNDTEGHLNIGRQTSNGARNLYFANKDFRKSSKVFYQIKNLYSDHFDIDYDIYKDKYWQSFERFNIR